VRVCRAVEGEEAHGDQVMLDAVVHATDATNSCWCEAVNTK
jgi:hypothetical protein